MRVKGITGVAIVFACADVPLRAQPENLKEAARAHGGTATRFVSLEFPVMQLSTLVVHSDLVVHARVAQQRTILNRDETDVLTEYSLDPLRVVHARTSDALAQPGQTNILVRRLGGTLVIDGQTLSTVVDVYKDAALATGEQALFFLMRGDDGAYRLVAGPFGIFRIRGGNTEPLTGFVKQLRGDKPEPLGQVLATIEKLSLAEVRQ
jgi:hypothetical protein